MCIACVNLGYRFGGVLTRGGVMDKRLRGFVEQVRSECRVIDICGVPIQRNGQKVRVLQECQGWRLYHVMLEQGINGVYLLSRPCGGGDD